MNKKYFAVSLDVGQQSDYSALSVIEAKDFEKRETRWYSVRHLQRFELKTPYPDVVSRTMVAIERLRGEDHRHHPAKPYDVQTRFCLDMTGLGRPIRDMFVRAGAKPVGVVITGGSEVSHIPGGFSVPKRELISNMAILMEGGKLKMAQRFKESTAVLKEFQNFRLKINISTGHDGYEAWREGDHDDLILSLAMGLWLLERKVFQMRDIAEQFRKAYKESSAIRTLQTQYTR